VFPHFLSILFAFFILAVSRTVAFFVVDGGRGAVPSTESRYLIT
jgi:hypothetical protein